MYLILTCLINVFQFDYAIYKIFFVTMCSPWGAYTYTGSHFSFSIYEVIRVSAWLCVGELSNGTFTVGQQFKLVLPGLLVLRRFVHEVRLEDLVDRRSCFRVNRNTLLDEVLILLRALLDWRELIHSARARYEAIVTLDRPFLRIERMRNLTRCKLKGEATETPDVDGFAILRRLREALRWRLVVFKVNPACAERLLLGQEDHGAS